MWFPILAATTLAAFASGALAGADELGWKLAIGVAYTLAMLVLLTQADRWLERRDREIRTAGYLAGWIEATEHHRTNREDRP